MKINLFRIVWPVLIISYFLTRLINLKIIPIFTDESIYSYWAQVALNDPANRFISLEDGKQPLFIWLAAILQQFITDPLIATRMVSVLAGFGSLIGIYILAKELFSQLSANRQGKIAILASILYIILPFTLLYDRMALFDSLLTMFGIYAVLFSVKMAKNPKLDLAILNGFAIGLAMITKSSGLIFLYLLPFSLILYKFNSKIISRKFANWIGLSLVTVFITQIIYNSLRLSPLFYIIARKNLSFIRTIQEVISNPFLFFFSNLNQLTQWVISYMGIMLLLILLVGLVIGYYKKEKTIIYLSILICAPFFAETIFNKVIYPRFILFYFPFIIIVLAATIFRLIDNYKKYLKYIIIALIISLIIPVQSSINLVTNPTNAKIAGLDLDQYLNSWPAGYGVEEIVEFLKEESKFNKVIIGTEGTFGLFPYALNIYFRSNPNVQILSFWPVDDNNLPQQIISASKDTKTFFVFNENQKEIINTHLKLIQKYQKGTGDSYMRLYEVTP